MVLAIPGHHKLATFFNSPPSKVSKLTLVIHIDLSITAYVTGIGTRRSNLSFQKSAMCSLVHPIRGLNSNLDNLPLANNAIA